MVLALAWSGCAARDSGYKITDATTAFIQRGVTTRAEVVENLGPPLFEIEDRGVAAYSWGRVRATGGRTPAGDPSMPSRRMSSTPELGAFDETGLIETQRWVYCIAYDQNGRVQRAERVKLNGAGISLEQAVRRWAGAAP
jgi:hypothetical protein